MKLRLPLLQQFYVFVELLAVIECELSEQILCGSAMILQEVEPLVVYLPHYFVLLQQLVKVVIIRR